MSFLLDTSVAIALRDNVETVAQRSMALSPRPAISVLTWVELEGGVSADPRLGALRREGLKTLLEILPVIDFTSEMARCYGELVARAGFSRRKTIDRMIAATALVCDRTLITCNGADFAAIPDLKLEIWTA